MHVGLRTFSHESGPPEASEAAKAFVRKHDVFVDFTVDVADAALALDLDLVIENPAPRNDPSLASSWPARAHLPQLWDMRRVRELRARHALSLLVVPQCAFGPGPHGKLFQKYTGLLVSRRVAARLADLRHLRCNHRAHDEMACGDNAALAAAYPAPLNDALVTALTGRRRTAPLPATAPPAVPQRPLRSTVLARGAPRDLCRQTDAWRRRWEREKSTASKTTSHFSATRDNTVLSLTPHVARPVDELRSTRNLADNDRSRLASARRSHIAWVQ